MGGVSAVATVVSAVAENGDIEGGIKTLNNVAQTTLPEELRPEAVDPSEAGIEDVRSYAADIIAALKEYSLNADEINAAALNTETGLKASGEIEDISAAQTMESDPIVEAALDNANIWEWFEGLPEVPAPKAYEIAVPAAVSNSSGQVTTPLDVLPGSGGEPFVQLYDGTVQPIAETKFPDSRIQTVYQTAGKFSDMDIANAYVYNYDGYTDPGIYTQEFQSIAQGAQDGLSFEDSVNGLPAAKQGGITEEVQQKIYDDVTDAFQAGGQTSYRATIPQSFTQGTASNGTTTVNVPTSHTVSPETGTGSTQNPLETVDGMGDNGYNGGEGTSEGAGESATKPYAKSRPSYGKTQVDDVWNNYKDPTTGKAPDPAGGSISWDKTKPRQGQWDMGHIPGEKYSDMHGRYIRGEISQKEFLEWYRNPANYRPELPSTNRSHKYE